MNGIKGKVNYLIEKFDTSCPFEISKCLGIQIVFEDLGNVLGYFSKHFRVRIIHINDTSEKEQQTFICAHELGHAVLHPNENTTFLKRNTLYSTSKLETEANTFAIHLLSKQTESITFHEAIERFGMPEQLMKKIYPLKEHTFY